MATRMQQRRGTAAQWSSANPILAAGEIGFETDTSKFRIGDGVNHWADLTYYASASEIAALIDGAPDLLNTLNELAAAIGDDANFATTIQNAVDLAEDNANTYTTGVVDAHNQDTTNVHGIPDTAALATQTDVSSAIDAHENASTNIHGIANTADLATKSYVDTAASGAVTAAETYADGAASSAVSDHNNDNTNVHGIADTSLLATKSYADSSATTAAGTAAASALQDAKDYADTGISTHSLDTTSVHGIADTSKLVLDTDLSDHATDTTNIHGIADTAALATKTYVDNAGAALQTNIDAKAPLASPTFTGTVSGITKSMVGLGNVDNTSDANKPVSTATQTALDAKASLSGATFTGAVSGTSLTLSGDLTVNGTTTTINATNLSIDDPLIYVGEGQTGNTADLGIVASFNDGTYQHSGIVRDSSDNKWKIFKGVTDEPTSTVNFAQGSLDALAVGALEATTVTPSSGVVFTDGTQTKEGVVSRTPIIQKTAAYTLSALTERDSLIEVASSTGVTITIPANSAVAYPVGTSIDILQTSTGQVTIAGAAGVTVNATPGLKLRTQWSSATLFKRATDTWVVMGDLSA